MAVERTLILIKPDATERALSGEILARIERRGFTVVGGKLLRVSEELGKEHYAEHSEKPFFGELVTFISSAPTWALVVEGEGAIATMRKTIGATNPADADPGFPTCAFAVVETEAEWERLWPGDARTVARWTPKGGLVTAGA